MVVIETLAQYLPQHAVKPLFALLQLHRVQLKITGDRTSKHGDYRKDRYGNHHVTINGMENKYRFMITLVHELAHLIAIKKYGSGIAPHGVEWKHTFSSLMTPFLNTNIFPAHLLPFLKDHFKNPRASSDVDSRLNVALSRYDGSTETTHLYELERGAIFAYRDKTYERGEQLRKRIKCRHCRDGKYYVFQPHAQVTLLKTR